MKVEGEKRVVLIFDIHLPVVSGPRLEVCPRMKQYYVRFIYFRTYSNRTISIAREHGVLHILHLTLDGHSTAYYVLMGNSLPIPYAFT